MLPFPAQRPGESEQVALWRFDVKALFTLAELQHATGEQAKDGNLFPTAGAVDMPRDFLPPVILIDRNMVEGDAVTEHH